MPLFDSYLMVDWSASKAPKTGKDSIWWALVERRGSRLRLTARDNPPTRAQATRAIGDLLAECRRRGRRCLAGFDFPFGYPTGFADRFGSAGPPWRRVWRTLIEGVRDRDDNANNRFDLAESLNRRVSKDAFPFWGHDGARDRRYLLRRGRRPHGPSDLPEQRLCEHRIRRVQPCWKLAYTGAVGSQALLGIPRVWELRNDPRLRGSARIWPFETGLAAPSPQPGDVVLAEVYPSLVPHRPEAGQVKDACQVRTIAEHFAWLDGADAFGPLFAGDPDLTNDERTTVEREEAWILGVTAGAAKG